MNPVRKPLLVASDVDGTLIDPLDRLTERTRRAVAAVRAAGIPFVLSTGRPPRWVHLVSDELELDGYAVTANGALVYDVGQRQVVRSWLLEPVLLGDVATALARAIPGCALAVERPPNGDEPTFLPDQPYGAFLSEHGYTHAWPESQSVEASRAEILGHPAIKLLVRHEGMNSSAMAVAAEAALAGAVGITFSTSAGLIELASPGITKATGLAWVSERLGVAQADVIAFGDMANDLEMIEWAGHGVAMANAHPELIALADEVTASNAEDGVAAVLERWF
ncbi:Cof-type HAD-IIB family hydrolase [Crossiella cryophila]|uniref:Cof-type HAD-IIB family hydrolase n=1 Tax=Crossiella cryophila TaxID=43355 RepID=UPI001C883FC4|nr:HAD family hydrolase [Crossiella cryophila]